MARRSGTDLQVLTVSLRPINTHQKTWCFKRSTVPAILHSVHKETWRQGRWDLYRFADPTLQVIATLQVRGDLAGIAASPFA